MCFADEVDPRNQPAKLLQQVEIVEIGSTAAMAGENG